MVLDLKYMICRLEDVVQFGSFGMSIEINAFCNDCQFTAISLLRIVSCLTQNTLIWKATFINPSAVTLTLAMKIKLMGVTGFLCFAHHLVLWRALKNKIFQRLDLFPSGK
jgi:hypothetical protein